MTGPLMESRRSYIVFPFEYWPCLETIFAARKDFFGITLLSASLIIRISAGDLGGDRKTRL